MEALVSVIIPVYNVSPFLREALDSVIHQTYKNLEILVIDDGSTDGSGTICNEYLSDPRVIVIHQENRGLSGARNTGLDHATGEYIAFLDSDDIFHPDMINSLMQSMLQNNADLAVCAYTIYKKAFPKTLKYRLPHNTKKDYVLSSRESIISLLIGSLPVNVWSKLYRRKLWEHLRFPERYVHEDVFVMPFLLEKCNNIAIHPRSLVYYRQRSNSISHNYTAKNHKDYMSAFQMVLTYTSTIQPPPPSEYLKIYKEKMLRSLVIEYVKLHRSKTFLNSPDLETILLKDIQNLSNNEPELIQMKTKAVWWLYRHCPGLLIPAQSCFRLLISILRKCKRGRL